MNEQGFYEYLSGLVPGGFAVVPVALLFLSYIWFEIVRHSGFISKRIFRFGLAAILLFVVLNFAILRITMAPLPQLQRIVVLPFTTLSSQNAWVGRAAAYSIEQMLIRQNLSKHSVMRSSNVTALSLYPSSTANDSLRRAFVRRAGGRYVITGAVTSIPEGFHCVVQFYDLKKQTILFELVEDVATEALMVFNRTVARTACTYFKVHRSGTSELIGITASPEAYRFHAAGRESLWVGDFDAARTLFQKSVQADTLCVYALLGQGVATRSKAILLTDIEKRDALLEEATEYFIKAIRMDALLGEGYMQLAWTHIFMEKWNEAENELKIAQHHMAMDAHIYYLMSKLNRKRYINYGFADVSEILHNAIRLSPVHTSAKLHMVDIYLNMNKKSDAMRLIQEVLLLDPENIQAGVTLSLVYIYMNEWDAAITTCRDILGKQSEHVDALYNIGISFKGLAEYDSAMVYLGKAAAQGNLNAYNYMAVIHESKQEYYAAIKMLRARVRLGARGEKWREESRKSLFRLVHKAGIVVDSSFSFQQLAISPAIDSVLLLQESGK